MKHAYHEFNKAGFGLSIEVRENNVLIGGIYGVLVEGVFSGESMFYKKPNASKLAVWFLVEYLTRHGHEWIDVQMVTPVVAQLGGRLVDREEYLQLLNERHVQHAISEEK
jgi:leucyl/phenylalanyl-tRNA--protein transferase